MLLEQIRANVLNVGSIDQDIRMIYVGNVRKFKKKLSQMLIRPLIDKDFKNRLPVSTNSLPSDRHDAFYGSESERLQSLESEGRLLMLTTMYREYGIKQNKLIHDILCSYKWPVCQCHFAKRVRAKDLGFSIEQSDRLEKIL